MQHPTLASRDHNAGVATPRRRSRAKPKPPRSRAVITAELRGLGGLVLEQALLDATAAPLTSLLEWANRLATELNVEGVGAPEDYREMLRAIVEVNKRAERAAELGLPTVRAA